MRVEKLMAKLLHVVPPVERIATARVQLGTAAVRPH
jgi:hypothetical protein